jgi:hypothetical protein
LPLAVRIAVLYTNIVSDISKGRDCEPKSLFGYDSIDHESIYVSVLALGEIRKSI